MPQKGFASYILVILGTLVASGLIIGGSFYVKYNKPELLEKNSQANSRIIPSNGYLVEYKNISFKLPIDTIDSQQEQGVRLIIKYKQDQVTINHINSDKTLKVSDLELDNNSFTNKYKSSPVATVGLQTKVIEELSGNYDVDLARDINVTDKLKLVKKLFLNLPEHTYSIVSQNGLTIIQDKGDEMYILSVEDKQGNNYQIFIKNDESTIQTISSSLNVK